MPIWEIEIEETKTVTVYVEADTREEACEVASEDASEILSNEFSELGTTAFGEIELSELVEKRPSEYVWIATDDDDGQWIEAGVLLAERANESPPVSPDQLTFPL